MKNNRLAISLIFLLFLPFALTAQEHLTGVGINQVVWEAQQAPKQQAGVKNCKKRNQEASLLLPFFEDFSTSKVFPDEQRWVEKDVFINQSFPYRSVNYGVATFDALNDQGLPYDDANWVTFTADHLTSRPIRTDSVFSPTPLSLSPKDSLFLSFFYQPQGRGDEPEPWDSLLLQFAYRTGDTLFDHMDSVDVLVDYYLQLYQTDTIFPGDTLWAPPGCNPNVYTISYSILIAGEYVTVACDSVMIPETKWETVWETEGMKLQEFQKKYKRNFVQVLVPLDDPIFFYDGFQFRFLNYASIANDIIPTWKGNCDQWNIDYIKLDQGRSVFDTLYDQVTFADKAPSFLKEFQAMPYPQYRADAFNSIAMDFKVYFNNLDQIQHQVSYSYQAQQINGSNGYTHTESPFVLAPYSANSFSDTLLPWQGDTMSCHTTSCITPPVAQYFALDYSADTMLYKITHYLTYSDANGTPQKDSIINYQGFYNYFAYDDGVPELGYLIEPAGAECAYQFKMNKPDTLQAVQFYFNRTVGNANETYFKLKVWRDNNGKPGQVIYREENVKVKWNEGTLYGFQYYPLEEPFLVQGTFYIGWEQYQDGGLNVGFDANNDHGNKIFYTLDGEWVQSAFHGSLLIRPVVGNKGFVGISETKNTNNLHELILYPNPAIDFITLDPSLFNNTKNYFKLRIFNIYGVPVIEKNIISNRIDLRNLNNGLYIVYLEKNGLQYSTRLIINK